MVSVNILLLILCFRFSALSDTDDWWQRSAAFIPAPNSCAAGENTPGNLFLAVPYSDSIRINTQLFTSSVEFGLDLVKFIFRHLISCSYIGLGGRKLASGLCACVCVRCAARGCCGSKQPLAGMRSVSTTWSGVS